MTLPLLFISQSCFELYPIIPETFRVQYFDTGGLRRDRSLLSGAQFYWTTVRPPALDAESTQGHKVPK
jgi:hypothetical protein